MTKKDDPLLGRWVARQRGERNHLLTAESRQLLDDLGFEWSIKQSEDQEVNWEVKFIKLEKYLKKGNPCSLSEISKFDESLGTWVANQRRRNHRGMLRVDRKKRLESISFEFGEPRKSRRQKLGCAQQDNWEKMFQRLVEFKEEHGHASVPYHYAEDHALALWVTTQRRDYNQKSWYGSKTSMRDNRRKSLEEIGFVWDMRSKTQVTGATRSDDRKFDCETTQQDHQEPAIHSTTRKKRTSKRTLRESKESNTDKLDASHKAHCPDKDLPTPKKKRASPGVSFEHERNQPETVAEI